MTMLSSGRVASVAPMVVPHGKMQSLDSTASSASSSPASVGPQITPSSLPSNNKTQTPPTVLPPGSRPRLERRSVTVGTSTPATSATSPFQRGLPPKSPSSATSSLRQLASQATLRGRNRRRDKQRRRRSGSKSRSRSRSRSRQPHSHHPQQQQQQQQQQHRRPSAQGNDSAPVGSNPSSDATTSSNSNRHRSRDSVSSVDSAICAVSNLDQQTPSVSTSNAHFMVGPDASTAPQHILDAELRNSLADLDLADDAVTPGVSNAERHSNNHHTPPRTRHNHVSSRRRYDDCDGEANASCLGQLSYRQKQQSSSPTSVAAHDMHIRYDNSSSSASTAVSIMSVSSFDEDASISSAVSQSSASSTKPGHRRSRSWNASMFEGWDEKDDRADGPPSKTCMPNMFKRPSRYGRHNKVPCADVASVGNASDTILETGASGREMHEAAKLALNAGDFVTARNMFMAIQRAQMNRFGQEHPSVGAAMHNVGVVQLRMGHHADAERTLHRAVLLRQNVLGPTHLDLAVTLSKLGSARIVLQKFEEGLGNLNDALQINRSHLGNEHKLVAQTLCQIACLYFEAGELEAAQCTFEEALDVFRVVFQHETVLYGQTANVYNPADTTNRDAIMAQITDTLCNIGSIQNKRKHHPDAIESFREALDLQRGIMGHDHPRVIATLDNLAYSYSKARKYQQALACYSDMLKAQLSRYNNVFTHECCVTLQKENYMHVKLRNIDGAIDSTKQALGKLYAAAGAQIQRGDVSPTSAKAVKDPVLDATEKILSDLLLKKIKKQRANKGCGKGCF